MRYLLQGSVLLVGISFLLLLNGSTNGLIDAGLQRSLALLVSAAALAWVAAGQRAPSPAGKALLVWFGLYLLAVLFSVDTRRSVTQMELMGLSVFWFLLSADLVARGWPRELFVKVLLWVGSLVLLVTWLGAGLWYRNWLISAPGQWIPDILFRPGSANIVAMFFNMLVMLAGGRLLVTRGAGGRLAWSFLVAAAGGMLYLTSSRGGWLGTAAGLTVLSGLAAWSGRIDPRRYWSFLRARPVLLVLGGIALVVVAAAGGIFLYQRTIHPTHAPISEARTEFWPPAWQSFLADPLTGNGPFTYAGWYLSANSVPPRGLFVHSHGTPFNLLAELGLVGAAGILVLAGTIVWGLGRQLSRFRAANQAADLGVGMGAAAALSAAAVHSLFDCFHTEPIGLWVLVIALGVALGRDKISPNHKRGGLGRFKNAWALALAALMWLEVWAVAPLHAAVELANSGRWEAALVSFDLAVARDPYSVIAYQQRALARSILAAHGDPAALQLAVEDLEAVVRREPTWALNYANLGALYAAQDQLEKAREVLAESLRRAPGCGLCALNLGIVEEAMGDAGMTAHYHLALDQGQPANAYFWRSSVARRAALESWQAGQEPAAAQMRAQLEAALSADPSSMRHYLRLAELAIEEDRLEEAESLLGRAALTISFIPREGLEREWLEAELLARRDDLEGAIQIGESVWTRYRMQGPYGPGSLGQLTYAPLMFRRPAMALELVPQMQVIPVADDWGQRVETLARWLEMSGNPNRAAQLREEIQGFIPE